MYKFIVLREDCMYKLEDKINDFLMNNPNIQVISHNVILKEYKVTDDIYFCTLIYKI